MKPTKEQLASVKWWDYYVGDQNYCYWQEKTKALHASKEKFSRSKLHEHGLVLLAKRPEPEWVPEVGVDCELKLGKSWVKCKVDYICEQYIVVLMHGSNTYEALVRGHYELRPIKTHREELIDIIVHQRGLGKNKAGAVSDAILARFDLTEKDGE